MSFKCGEFYKIIAMALFFKHICQCRYLDEIALSLGSQIRKYRIIFSNPEYTLQLYFQVQSENLAINLNLRITPNFQNTVKKV